MARITFQKRQKQMKRLEKQRAKAERRAQKKLEKNNEPGNPNEELEVLTESAPLEDFSAEPQD